MRASREDARVRYTAGFFKREEDLLAAASDARESGFEIYDAYTPVPVHGLDAAVGLKRSNLTSSSRPSPCVNVATTSKPSVLASSCNSLSEASNSGSLTELSWTAAITAR